MNAVPEINASLHCIFLKPPGLLLFPRDTLLARSKKWLQDNISFLHDVKQQLDPSAQIIRSFPHGASDDEVDVLVVDPLLLFCLPYGKTSSLVHTEVQWWKLLILLQSCDYTRRSFYLEFERTSHITSRVLCRPKDICGLPLPCSTSLQVWPSSITVYATRTRT
ncbi:hypothetical protein DENSPDRAFT_633545 [Dentipellis sp. KUC8613]|nr:hypothetical protein DENSPDRAFT_633545 [Dentipellis sp. KUC8613]